MDHGELAGIMIKNINRNIHEWRNTNKKNGKELNMGDLNSIVKNWIIRTYKEHVSKRVPYGLEKAKVQFSIIDEFVYAIKIDHWYREEDITIALNNIFRVIDYKKYHYKVTDSIDLSSIRNVTF